MQSAPDTLLDRFLARISLARRRRVLGLVRIGFELEFVEEDPAADVGVAR